jgi:hypothetical protein
LLPRLLLPPAGLRVRVCGSGEMRPLDCVLLVLLASVLGSTGAQSSALLQFQFFSPLSFSLGNWGSTDIL